MQQALLDQLRKITEEERKILDGEAEVDRDLYTSGRDFTVDSRKMLKEGRLIAVRTHTRLCISGSQAQFSNTVSPSASTAPKMPCWVAPTLLFEKETNAPCR